MIKNQDEMANEKVGKLLVKFSSPAIIGMLSSVLFNITDTIFVGRGVGSKGIAALVIAFPVQMLLMALAQGIGVGSASLISRSLGAGDKRQAEAAAGMSITAITILGASVAALGLLFLEPLSTFIGASASILAYVVEYLSVILLGSIFYVVSLSMSFIVRAEGKPNVAMYCIMIGTLLNVALDPVFILGFKMGIMGAALATVISQFFSLAYITIYFGIGKSNLKIRFQDFAIRLKLLGKVVAVGISAFVRIISMLIFFVVINKSIMYFGSYFHLAVFGVFNRVLSLFTLPLFGIAQGLQPIIGFNFGAGKYERVKEGLKLASYAATALCIIGFIVLMAVPGFVIRIFSDDADLIQKGTSIMRTLIIFFPLVGFHQISTSFFQSIGKAIPALILSVSRQILFSIPLILILPLMFNINGIWYSIPLADLLAAILTVILLKKEFMTIGTLKKANA